MNYINRDILARILTGVITVLCALHLFSCGKGGVEPDIATPIRVYSNNTCKYNTSKPADDTDTENLTTVIRYSYNGKSELQLFHSDLFANCCLDELTATISIEGNTITIRQDEYFSDGMACACVCPYDMAMTLTTLSPGTYKIIIYEPYEFNGQEYLEFNLSLFDDTSDVIIIQRP